jgi:LmbE family N-acetylglucosaminyl deacetylase
MTTLVIGAHPDDEVLGVGGTIAKLAAAGEIVHVLIVTDGSSTQYPGDHVKRAHKKVELEACCRTLGVSEVVHGALPDMQLDTVPHTKLNDFIGDHVARWRPDTVYTHYPDVNRDHVRIFESTMVVARPRPGAFVRRLLVYPTPSATEWDAPVLKRPFVPTCYVDIEAHLDTKIEALACYGTEIRPYPHPRSSAAIRAIAAGVGVKVGMKAAEEFMLLRDIAWV